MLHPMVTVVKITVQQSSTYHLLINAEQFFTSHTHLHFLTGEYFLNYNLKFSNITDITLSGQENVIWVHS